jgi:hypothetical protein
MYGSLFKRQVQQHVTTYGTKLLLKISKNYNAYVDEKWSNIIENLISKFTKVFKISDFCDIK